MTWFTNPRSLGDGDRNWVNNGRRAEEMACSIKLLLYMHENLSLDPPRTHVKNQMWKHVPLTSALGRHRQEDPGDLLASQSNQSASFKFSERSCFKNWRTGLLLNQHIVRLRGRRSSKSSLFSDPTDPKVVNLLDEQKSTVEIIEALISAQSSSSFVSFKVLSRVNPPVQPTINKVGDY